ncbi:hypothetical protein [Blautia wexlerae]|uniref:hypothetical protein n=1 Tax=Blautia wexlerae TaxID=418240 RepID=UPI00156F9A3F|nr:hypothetical protein [Blautia wexlerae]NSG51267.1 hypothetical protein [Blautia wexlerae]
MKKRYLILAGLLVMTVAAAGCGKKKTTETAPVEVTATPTPEVTKAVDMVDMQQTADEDIKNVMGEKTSTASKIVFVNNTGDDIQSLYIRTHVDEDSEDYDADEDGGWGDDLINGMFTLTDKDKALYYMQTANTQTSGTQTSGTQTSGTQTSGTQTSGTQTSGTQTSGTQTSDTQTSDTQTTSNKSTASYDIRIAYADEDKNECFFRDIPLGTISQITLCMDGTDDDAIPYAKYLTGTSTKEVSTLDAVKERLGITDDSESESDSTDDSDKKSADNSDSTDSNNSSDQNNNSGNGTGDNSDDPGNGGNSDDPGTNDNPGSNDDPGNGGDMISTAEQYIGQSLDALEGACGSPQGSSYEDDPETGKTGFHYYSNFTVSTTVDENGNEIVAGIW